MSTHRFKPTVTQTNEFRYTRALCIIALALLTCLGMIELGNPVHERRRLKGGPEKKFKKADQLFENKEYIFDSKLYSNYVYDSNDGFCGDAKRWWKNYFFGYLTGTVHTIIGVGKAIRARASAPEKTTYTFKKDPKKNRILAKIVRGEKVDHAHLKNIKVSSESVVFTFGTLKNLNLGHISDRKIKLDAATLKNMSSLLDGLKTAMGLENRDGNLSSSKTKFKIRYRDSKAKKCMEKVKLDNVLCLDAQSDGKPLDLKTKPGYKKPKVSTGRKIALGAAKTSVVAHEVSTAVGGIGSIVSLFC